MQVFPPCFEALAAVDKHDRRPRRHVKRRGINSMFLRPREAIDERPPVRFSEGLLNLLHCGILAECAEQSLHQSKLPMDSSHGKRGSPATQAARIHFSLMPFILKHKTAARQARAAEKFDSMYIRITPSPHAHASRRMICRNAVRFPRLAHGIRHRSREP